MLHSPVLVSRKDKPVDDRCFEHSSDALPKTHLLNYLDGRTIQLTTFYDGIKQRSSFPSLLLGSIEQARGASLRYSLMECCRLHGVNQIEYMNDVLKIIETYPKE